MTTSTRRPEPAVGMPATIHLFSDTLAAVVVKVNAKSIQVARVATTDRERINDHSEPYPCYIESGVLDQIIGSPERYRRIDTPEGPRYANGSISVSLGRSYKITDYRY